MKKIKPQWDPATLPQDGQAVLWQTDTDEINGVWRIGSFKAETSDTVASFKGNGEGNNIIQVHKILHWLPAPEETIE